MDFEITKLKEVKEEFKSFTYREIMVSYNLGLALATKFIAEFTENSPGIPYCIILHLTFYIQCQHSVPMGQIESSLCSKVESKDVDVGVVKERVARRLSYRRLECFLYPVSDLLLIIIIIIYISSTFQNTQLQNASHIG